MSAAEDGPPRKRVRKGTRSCWECRRRKIRCQFASEAESICVGCRSRGSKCVSQEHPEEHDSVEDVPLRDRLRRMEALLDTLVNRSEASSEGFRTLRHASPVDNDVATFDDQLARRGGGVVFSLFDNAVLTRRPKLDESDSVTPYSPSADTPASSVSSVNSSAQRTLSALLPSQHDADWISDTTHTWMILFSKCNWRTTDKAYFNPETHRFDIDLVAKAHPTMLARTLLYLALCLTMLPRHIDVSHLETISSIDDVMHKWVTAVQSLVTCDDEQMCTLAGIECLWLLSGYQVSTGHVRRTWLTIRRALTYAEMLGLHRMTTVPSTSSGERDGAIETAKSLWNQMCSVESFLGLHLHLPCHAPPALLPTIPEPTVIERHRHYLGTIARETSNLYQDGANMSYTKALSLDSQLDAYARELPAKWFDNQPPPPEENLLERARFNELTVGLMWHFQLKSFIHLPFMLRAHQEPRFEYSRLKGLSGSRETLRRWLRLTRELFSKFCFPMADFAAFVSAIAIILDLLHSSPEKNEDRAEDEALIQEVRDELVRSSRRNRTKIAAQSVEAIGKLLELRTPRGELAHEGSSLRLTIPYFGTLNITRKQPVRDTDLSATPHQLHPPAAQGFGAASTWQPPVVPTDTVLAPPTTGFEMEDGFFGGQANGVLSGAWDVGLSEWFFEGTVSDVDAFGDWM